MKTVLSLYKEYLDKGLIRFDKKQNSVLLKINKVINFEKGVLSFFKKIFLKNNNNLKGIYLWGNAGSGKTMIMDLCFSVSNAKNKKRIHFQEFMIDIHDRLHEKRKNNLIKDPLSIVAEEISEDIDFLCFDEFQVNDIADASILAKLFNLLFENGTFIFSTSNIVPNELYKDGLQRDRFIPFINLIEEECLNLELSTDVDYRKNKLQNVNTYFAELNENTSNEIEKIFINLTNGAELEPRKVIVKGREILVERHAMGCARFNFDDLCNVPLGPEDFLTIAREFDIIFIENVPKLSSDKRNEVKRFISLIDSLYDNRKMTIVSADGEPENIYSKGELEFEFKRCISRLHEMRSKDYIDSSRIN
jgi:cell division protein ZapE